jgi:hypothetical protein
MGIGLQYPVAAPTVDLNQADRPRYGSTMSRFVVIRECSSWEFLAAHLQSQLF